MLIGVVSDTHGYLNPKVPELLAGVEHILHAGDIGDAGIIAELARIAPVTTVRGNNDRTGPESLFPEEVTVELDGWNFFLTHEVKVPKGPDDPSMETYRKAGADVVVFGHSHIALQRQIGTVLFFNPGAAGKRRFKVVPSIGILKLELGRVEGTIIPI
ncbi:MAG: metallophosphoesterase family protein [Chloroflexi bacterium]|nr:metallophosphoesterase family protein [Chloroflexota bacterium]